MVTISIIIPVFNAEKFIYRTLKSVQNQTFTDFECIIVDDGSTDNSRKIIKSFSDKRFKSVLLKQNSGESNARNFGLKKAKGSYIYFLDADDQPKPYALDSLYSNLHNQPHTTIASLGRFNLIFPNKKTTKNYSFGPGVQNITNTLQIKNDIVPGTMLIRASIAKNIQFNPDISLGEDWIYWLKVSHRGNVNVITDIVLNYTIHKKQQSQRNLFKFDQRKKTLQEILKVSSNNNKPLAIRNFYLSNIFYSILHKRWKDARQNYARYKQHGGTLKSICDGLIQRSYLLKSNKKDNDIHKLLQSPVHIIPYIRKKAPGSIKLYDACKLLFIFLLRKHLFSKYAYKTINNTKHLGICICVEFESPQRILNTRKVLNHLLKTTQSNIYIYETGQQKHNLLQDKRIIHTFTKTTSRFYHKTKHLNEATKHIKEDYILFLDADILLNSKDIEICLQRIIENRSDVCYPYNGLVIDSNSPIKNTSILSLILQGASLIGFGRATGGAILLSKNNLSSIGGFNQKIIGWGYEDIEFYSRAKLAGLRIFRSKSYAFHLRHPRTQKSLPTELTIKGKEQLKTTNIREYLSTLTPRKKITLVTAADSNFVKPVRTMLASVAKKLDTSYKADVYIISNALQQKDFNLLNNKYANLNIIVVELKLSKTVISRLNFGHVTPAALYRLYIGNLLPPSVKKVLYLDADIIVNTDISKLWNISITNCIIAACKEQEKHALHLGSKDGLSTWKILELDPKTPQFNTGVMLINLEKWRNYKVLKKSLHYLEKYANTVRWWDQDSLNAILHNKTKYLDPTWNVQSQSFYSTKPKSVHPNIIHFNTALKPWHWYSFHPHTFLYRYHESNLHTPAFSQIYLWLHNIYQPIATSPIGVMTLNIIRKCSTKIYRFHHLNPRRTTFAGLPDKTT